MFWVRHGIACRRISAYIAEKLGQPVLNNIWIPDGYKDIPADRLGPRLRLKDSLDRIYAEKLDGVIDCVESKVFGIGLESLYRRLFGVLYGLCRARIPAFTTCWTTAIIIPPKWSATRFPALLAFFDKLPLHVTRPRALGQRPCGASG